MLSRNVVAIYLLKTNKVLWASDETQVDSRKQIYDIIRNLITKTKYIQKTKPEAYAEPNQIYSLFFLFLKEQFTSEIEPIKI